MPKTVENRKELPHTTAILIQCETYECDNTGKLVTPVKVQARTLSIPGLNYEDALNKLKNFLEYVSKHEEN